MIGTTVLLRRPFRKSFRMFMLPEHIYICLVMKKMKILRCHRKLLILSTALMLSLIRPEERIGLPELTFKVSLREEVVIGNKLQPAVIISTDFIHQTLFTFRSRPANFPSQERHCHTCIPFFLRQYFHNLLFYFCRVIAGCNS